MTSAVTNAPAGQLTKRDYTLIIDKSASMGYTDVPHYRDRWHAVQESTQGLARKLDKIDPDGITLYTFSNSFKRYENVTPSRVDQVFSENEPNGGTNLHLALADAFNNWRKRKRDGTLGNGEHIIVVTDGEPTDPEAVEKEIIKVSKEIESPGQLTLSLLQAGQDVGAGKYLKHLDDGLTSKGAKCDFVNTKTFDEMGELPLHEVISSSIDS